MQRLPVLSLLHTSPAHVALFERLAAEAVAKGAPEVRLSHSVREDLLARAIQSGVLPEDTHARAVRILHEATASSDAVLCTCSTLGPAADEAAARADKPVLRVDRPMAREAVATGRAIAVLATLACTLEPTARLIEAEARALGRSVDVAPVLVEGAWDANVAGNGVAAHGLIAEQARLAEAAGADAIVLAQASMAGALAGDAPRVCMLTSPASGLAAAVAAVTQAV